MRNLYLARVFIGRKPIVNEVSPHEFVIYQNRTFVLTAQRLHRANFSWIIRSFGDVGAAAISDTRASAIGAAKCKLESRYV